MKSHLSLKRLLTGLFAVTVLFCLVDNARADIQLSLLSKTGTGPFTYTYTVNLQPGSALFPAPIANQVTALNPGGHDLFTLYDVMGLVSGSETSTISPPFGPGLEFLVGETPITQNPPDSVTITNITFEYDGAGIIDNTTSSAITLGTISFVSTIDATAGSTIFYSAATQRSSAVSDPGNIANNTSTVIGPGLPIPEPASMVLLLAGLPVVGVMARRLRKRTA